MSAGGGGPREGAGGSSPAGAPGDSASHEPDLDPVLRREYPGLGDGGGIFMNAASYGILPRSAAAAVRTVADARTRVRGVEELPLGAELSRTREALARLLRVPAHEITLAPNTSFGVNLAAELAAAGEAGTILLSEGEFPTNVYPWMALERRGFRVELLPAGPDGLPDEARMLERVEGGEVRVLAVSAVQFSSGFRHDLPLLGAACRERGVLLAVDAIQALGAVPLHPREIGADVVACGGQKWLCAPWGSGFVWMDARHRERVAPPMVSWLAMEASMDFESVLDYRWELLDDGRRFELATLGIQDHTALGRSVEMFLEMGPEAVAARIREVQEPLMRWLEGRDDVVRVTPADPARRAGIVAFRPPDPVAVGALLEREGVVAVVREGAVRLAPHVYNTREEMERVVSVLEAGIARG